MTGTDGKRWVGTWTTTPDPVEEKAIGGRTVRVVARISLGGAAFRVRISNAYGQQDLVIRSAALGIRHGNGDIIGGSSRNLLFAGRSSIQIPAGAFAVSDPVYLEAPDLADLVVSVCLPSTPEGFRFTGHENGHQTNYISQPGDFTTSDVFPLERETDSFLLVSGVEVHATQEAGSIVAFGDSLTEGNLSQLDANHRWPDQLARRFAARTDGRRFGVVNQGIGGNRLLHDGRGESGLRRFDRDVLAQPGVTHTILMLGINDLRNSSRKSEEIVSAEQLMVGLQQLAARARASGIQVIGATLLPWENETFKGGFYTPEAEVKRKELNSWIREGADFDSVIDFEAALRDPNHPTRMLPQWDSGDHLHPSDAGYRNMGECIDLALFD